MTDLSRLEQNTIEDKYSRKNIYERISQDIAESSDAAFTAKHVKAMGMVWAYLGGKYYKQKMDRLIRIKKRAIADIDFVEHLVNEILIITIPCSTQQPVQTIASQLASYLDYGDDVFAGVTTAAEILAVVSKSEIYDMVAARDSETGSIGVRSRYNLEESTLQFIANTKYLPPMICVPQEVTHNYQSGYLTKDESIVLGAGNGHDSPLALDAINIASSVALSLDVHMMAFEETSKKPLDTIQKKETFRRMVNSTKTVTKELIDHGNKFYLTWKADKRGRLYSQGYQVNIQASSYKKSCINLHEKHLITGV